MRPSIGVIQKTVFVGEFVEDGAVGRPEIKTWPLGHRQIPVFIGEFQETAKVPPRHQLRNYVIQLRNGSTLRVTGHSIKYPRCSIDGFVTVIYRTLTSTSTVALVAADEVLSIIEEQPSLAPTEPASAVVGPTPATATVLEPPSSTAS